MNLLGLLSRDIGRAGAMTLPELEAALAEGESKTISELTALSLAKKAAEGGMDAIKLIRELSKGEPTREDTPSIEIRVVGEGDEGACDG